METNLFVLIIAGLLAGIASGFLGSFMVIKRMSLVGDALSHIALPGMAIAIMLGINLMIGAFAFLALAIVGIFILEEKTENFPEGLVGIFFTASLAIGILITPKTEIYESLFGDIDKITQVDSIFIIFLSILLVATTSAISKKLIKTIISKELAISEGIKTSKINFIYLLMVGVAVSLGIKFLGTLLTGALVIIPAVSAKNISSNLKQYFTFSTFFGALSSILGIIIARTLDIPTGPGVIIVGIAIFTATAVLKIATKQI